MSEPTAGCKHAINKQLNEHTNKGDGPFNESIVEIVSEQNRACMYE